MSFVSIGDLSQSLQLRRENARMSTELAQLSRELSSGRVDPHTITAAGDYGPLASIERSLAVLTSYRTSGKEAALLADAAQTAAGSIRTSAGELVPTLLLARTSAQPSQIDALGADAAARFDAMVGRLNTQVAGRSIFAGSAVDGPALRPGQEILDRLEVLTSGEASASDVEAALDVWFGPGGEYETWAYLGSAQPLSNLPISETRQVTAPPSALDDGFRETLKGAAMAALLERNALSGNVTERQSLAVRAGEVLLSADAGLLSVSAGIGVSEQSIEQSRAAVEAEFAATELARSHLIAADPFDTASRLQALQTQLETFYTVTARLSRMSLADFLR